MALGNLTVDTNIIPHGMPVYQNRRVSAGYQQITDLSTAIGLTVPVNARMALIQAQTADVRWRDDGTDPDANTGLVIVSGVTLEYLGDLYAFRAFSATGALNITYYY